MNDESNDDQKPDDKVRKWLKVIDAYDKEFKPWHQRCEKIIKIYTEKRKVEGSEVRRFSMLWSNISVLQPAVYARTPEPNISRRFKDDDPIARAASEIMERCVRNSFDTNDFDAVMKSVRDDYLLVGRGTSWVRYESYLKPLVDGDGNALNKQGQPLDEEAKDEPGEEIDSECVERDYVNWRDFGHAIARTWREVPTVWRKVYMDRESGIKRFGEKFKTVDLDHKAGDDSESKGTETGEEAKATVYEIWDKPSKKVIFLARSSKELLEESDPYLNFRDFFPCPKPVYGTLQTSSLIPVPDYVFYQDQVEEIDDLTARIGALTDQLKVVGLYAATATDSSDAIQEIALAGVENKMIPVPNWNQFKEGGGIGGMVEWWPVDQVIKVLEGCFKARKALIDDVYQLTGISDIMRGEGDKDETATAQGIKQHWGSVRIRERQSALADFARDNARLTAEIIAEKFQPETLLAMSNVKLPSQKQLDQIALQQQIAQLQARAAQMQAPPMPGAPPPGAMPPAAMPQQGIHA